jgi:hypothetical protein
LDFNSSCLSFISAINSSRCAFNSVSRLSIVFHFLGITI